MMQEAHRVVRCQMLMQEVLEYCVACTGKPDITSVLQCTDISAELARLYRQLVGLEEAVLTHAGMDLPSALHGMGSRVEVAWMELQRRLEATVRHCYQPP